MSTCDLCELESASVQCVECTKDGFPHLCEGCDSSMHAAKGSKRNHRRSPIGAAAATGKTAPAIGGGTGNTLTVNIPPSPAHSRSQSMMMGGGLGSLSGSGLSSLTGGAPRGSLSLAALAKNSHSPANSIMASRPGFAGVSPLHLTPNTGARRGKASMSVDMTHTYPNGAGGLISVPQCDVCDEEEAKLFCDTCSRDGQIESTHYCDACDQDFHMAKKITFHFRMPIQEMHNNLYPSNLLPSAAGMKSLFGEPNSPAHGNLLSAPSHSHSRGSSLGGRMSLAMLSPRNAAANPNMASTTPPPLALTRTATPAALISPPTATQSTTPATSNATINSPVRMADPSTAVDTLDDSSRLDAVAEGVESSDATPVNGRSRRATPVVASKTSAESIAQAAAQKKMIDEKKSAVINNTKENGNTTKAKEEEKSQPDATPPTLPKQITPAASKPPVAKPPTPKPPATKPMTTKPPQSTDPTKASAPSTDRNPTTAPAGVTPAPTKSPVTPPPAKPITPKPAATSTPTPTPTPAAAAAVSPSRDPPVAAPTPAAQPTASTPAAGAAPTVNTQTTTKPQPAKSNNATTKTTPAPTPNTAAHAPKAAPTPADVTSSKPPPTASPPSIKSTPFASATPIASSASVAPPVALQSSPPFASPVDQPAAAIKPVAAIEILKESAAANTTESRNQPTSTEQTTQPPIAAKETESSAIEKLFKGGMTQVVDSSAMRRKPATAPTATTSDDKPAASVPPPPVSVIVSPPVAAAAVAVAPVPASSAVSSASFVSPLCDICEDYPSEVHCALCAMHLCVAGGCDKSMHANAKNSKHQRITMQQNKTNDTNTSETTSDQPNNNKDDKTDPAPAKVEPVVSAPPLPSASASVSAAGPAPSPAAASPPPPPAVITSPPPVMCEICEEYPSEVHCASCAMSLCVVGGCDKSIHANAKNSIHQRTKLVDPKQTENEPTKQPDAQTTQTKPPSPAADTPAPTPAPAPAPPLASPLPLMPAESILSPAEQAEREFAEKLKNRSPRKGHSRATSAVANNDANTSIPSSTPTASVAAAAAAAPALPLPLPPPIAPSSVPTARKEATDLDTRELDEFDINISELDDIPANPKPVPAAAKAARDDAAAAVDAAKKQQQVEQQLVVEAEAERKAKQAAEEAAAAATAAAAAAAAQKKLDDDAAEAKRKSDEETAKAAAAAAAAESQRQQAEAEQRAIEEATATRVAAEAAAAALAADAAAANEIAAAEAKRKAEAAAAADRDATARAEAIVAAALAKRQLEEDKLRAEEEADARIAQEQQRAAAIVSAEPIELPHSQKQTTDDDNTMSPHPPPPIVDDMQARLKDAQRRKQEARHSRATSFSSSIYAPHHPPPAQLTSSHTALGSSLSSFVLPSSLSPSSSLSSIPAWLESERHATAARMAKQQAHTEALEANLAEQKVRIDQLMANASQNNIQSNSASSPSSAPPLKQVPISSRLAWQAHRDDPGVASDGGAHLTAWQVSPSSSSVSFSQPALTSPNRRRPASAAAATRGKRTQQTRQPTAAAPMRTSASTVRLKARLDTGRSSVSSLLGNSRSSKKLTPVETAAAAATSAYFHALAQDAADATSSTSAESGRLIAQSLSLRHARLHPAAAAGVTLLHVHANDDSAAAPQVLVGTTMRPSRPASASPPSAPPPPGARRSTLRPAVDRQVLAHQIALQTRTGTFLPESGLLQQQFEMIKDIFESQQDNILHGRPRDEIAVEKDQSHRRPRSAHRQRASKKHISRSATAAAPLDDSSTSPDLSSSEVLSSLIDTTPLLSSSSESNPRVGEWRAHRSHTSRANKYKAALAEAAEKGATQAIAKAQAQQAAGYGPLFQNAAHAQPMTVQMQQHAGGPFTMTNQPHPQAQPYGSQAHIPSVPHMSPVAPHVGPFVGQPFAAPPPPPPVMMSPSPTAMHAQVPSSPELNLPLVTGVDPIAHAQAAAAAAYYGSYYAAAAAAGNGRSATPHSHAVGPSHSPVQPPLRAYLPHPPVTAAIGPSHPTSARVDSRALSTSSSKSELDFLYHPPADGRPNSDGQQEMDHRPNEPTQTPMTLGAPPHTHGDPNGFLPYGGYPLMSPSAAVGRNLNPSSSPLPLARPIFASPTPPPPPPPTHSHTFAYHPHATPIPMQSTNTSASQPTQQPMHAHAHMQTNYATNQRGQY